MSSLSPWRAPLLAAAALALAAPSAGAATYEQISRGDGALGASSPVGQSVEGVASDTGLFGIYSTLMPTNGFLPDSTSYLRNTLLNRTTPVDTKGQVFDVDRSERTLLTYEFGFGGSKFAISKPVGGTSQPVVTLPSSGFSNATLSGDGRTVAYSTFEGGTHFYDVATGAVTTPTPDFVGVDRYSLSDDAKVLAGWTYDEAANTESGVIVKNGVSTTVSGRAHVNPNGDKVFYIADAADGGKVLVTRRLANGVETRKAIPASVGTPYILWISPAGDRVAVGPDTNYSYAHPGPEAQVLTGNRWSVFGGAYSREFANGTAAISSTFSISRNGRYAVVGFNDQVALVALEGQLLAAGEPLAPAAYYGGRGTPQCYGPFAPFSAYLARPAAWVSAPRRAYLTLRSGTNVILDHVQNTVPPQIPLGDNDETPDPAYDVQVPTDGVPLTLEWTVVDHTGRTLTETYTVPGCPVFEGPPFGEE